MPFYYRQNGGTEADEFELRNEWRLETGADTEKKFCGRQFERNCRELQHFGYHYIGMYGYIPKYMEWSRRVYPECIKLEIGEESMTYPLFQRTKCSVLRMDFQCEGTGGTVYLYIRHKGLWGFNMGYPVMWLSKDQNEWKETVGPYHTYVTYHFTEPVFAPVLKKYGLLREEKGAEKTCLS